MSDSYPWDEQETRTRVDSAGCLNGQINRPADTLVSWDSEGEIQYIEIGDPEENLAFVRAENPVDLEAHR